MSVLAKSVIVVLVGSALSCLLSLPLIRRRVPPNLVYGYRTRATLSDEALWYEANAYFGRKFLLASLLSACGTAALLVWRGLSPEACIPVTVVLLSAPVALAAVLTSRFVRQWTACPSRPSSGSSGQRVCASNRRR
jgi:uncharacterized membrane protein